LFAHDLFGKPLHAFPDHGLEKAGAAAFLRLRELLPSHIRSAIEVAVRNRRERNMDSQTKREIMIVTIASLAPIPLITAAVVAILY
jgi:hypothetical protein